MGTVHHLGFEMLKARTGSFVVHVPYRGASQIVPDVISGQVPIGVVSAAAGMAQAKAGKLRAVGLMSSGQPAGRRGRACHGRVRCPASTSRRASCCWRPPARPRP